MEMKELLEKFKDYVLAERKSSEELNIHNTLSVEFLSKSIDHVRKLEKKEIPEYAGDVFEYAENMNEFIRIKMKEMNETQKKLIEQNKELTRQLNYSNPYAKFVN